MPLHLSPPVVQADSTPVTHVRVAVHTKRRFIKRIQEVDVLHTHIEKGFNIAHATDKSMLEMVAEDPFRAKRFAEAMSLFNSTAGTETKSVVDYYPWESLQDGAVVIDVGGSHGDIAIALAHKYSKLMCIVQDLPGVVASAKVQAGLAKQVSFMAHDFFAEQPLKNADVYFFKWIFHDWSDKYCIKILRELIPALKKGARIVVNEFIDPTPGTLPIYLEAASLLHIQFIRGIFIGAFC